MTAALRAACLARPRGACHEQVHPVAHERQHVGQRHDLEEPAALEVGEGRRPWRGQSHRHERADRRYRGERGVHPDAVAEPGVDERAGLIHMSSPRGDEPDGKVARLWLGDRHVGAQQSPAAVDPHGTAAVDEHVGHARISHERCEHAEVDARRTTASRDRTTRREPLHTPTLRRGMSRTPPPAAPVHSHSPTGAVEDEWPRGAMPPAAQMTKTASTTPAQLAFSVISPQPEPAFRATAPPST